MSDGNTAVSPARRDRDGLQFDVAFKVMLTSRRFRARFSERLKGSGATDARCSALYMLSDAPEGLIQTELAERMGIQGPTLVRLLDSLEASGLVERTEAPSDRRAKLVILRDAGRELLVTVDVIAGQLRNDAFAGISEEELDVAGRVLDSLAKALDPAASSKPSPASGKVMAPRGR